MIDKSITKVPLMPKATAVWLVNNTSLTFKQIADFCGIHELEVKSIENEEVAVCVTEFDPILNGQLTLEEIKRCTDNPSMKLRLNTNISSYIKKDLNRHKTKYTPLARRRDKPDAIQWVIQNHPEIPNKEIVKLLGTTEKTIMSIRERTHWNIKNIRPRHPVLLDICAQSELDKVLQKIS